MPGQRSMGRKVAYYGHAKSWLGETKSGGAAWGLAAAPGVRVTQMYVEKLTSLTAQKYSCGGGSNYSY